MKDAAREASEGEGKEGPLEDWVKEERCADENWMEGVGMNRVGRFTEKAQAASEGPAGRGCPRKSGARPRGSTCVRVARSGGLLEHDPPAGRGRRASHAQCRPGCLARGAKEHGWGPAGRLGRGHERLGTPRGVPKGKQAARNRARPSGHGEAAWEAPGLGW